MLLKFKSAFAPFIYVITKAPKFAFDDEGNKFTEKSYIPFAKQKDLNEDQKNDEIFKGFVGKELKQKLKLTSEEAYSFAVIRQMLLTEPLEVDKSNDDTTPDEERIGQLKNPIDISSFDLDPVYIKLVA